MCIVLDWSMWCFGFVDVDDFFGVNFNVGFLLDMVIVVEVGGVFDDLVCVRLDGLYCFRIIWKCLLFVCVVMYCCICMYGGNFVWVLVVWK